MSHRETEEFFKSLSPEQVETAAKLFCAIARGFVYWTSTPVLVKHCSNEGTLDSGGDLFSWTDDLEEVFMIVADYHWEEFTTLIRPLVREKVSEELS